MTRQQQQEEQLKAVFESSQDCILVWDKDYNYLYANQAAIDHVNTTADKVIGKNMRDALGHIPDFMHLWMSRVDEVFKTGKPLQVEDAMPIGDRLVYSHSVLSPVRYPGGEMFAVSVVYRDMTEHKKLQQELTVSENRFQSLVECIPDPICVVEPSGCFAYMNSEACSRLGMASDQAIGLHHRDIFLPETADSVEKFHQRVIQSGTAQSTLMQVQQKDATRWYSISAQPILDKSGQTTSYIVVAHDIHEIKLLEEKLSASEHKYRMLYEKSPIPLYQSRISDGKLIMCNNALAKIIGFSSATECIEAGFSITDSYVNPDRREQLLNKLKKHGKVKDFEVHIRQPDGTTLWIAITAEIFPEQDCIEGTVQDISIGKLLTSTEREVLDLLMQGKSNKEIAWGTSRSIRTIEDHRARIMRKLGVDNIVALTQKVLNIQED